MSRQFTKDSSLEIAAGRLYDGSVNKYGKATNGIQTTPTDIWDRADASTTQQIWIAPTQARIHQILSTSDQDSDTGGTVAQGNGARTIRVYGLTTWGTAESSEDIIMDGTATGVNAVNTANSYVIIHRMKVLTHGTGGPNAGIITAIAATDGTITAQISVGQGQTLMAIYGVPSTQTAYMTCYTVSAHESLNPVTASETEITLLINESPDVDELPAGFLNKSNLGLRTTGTLAFTRCYKPYLKVVGPAIIKFQATASGADIEGVAEFDLILENN